MTARRRSLEVLILAAGQGKRLRSKTVKLLHSVAGRPVVAHVLDTVHALRPTRVVVVVGHDADGVRAALAGFGCTFVLQREQRGTGHAVLQAARQLARSRGATLLIVNGDLPALGPQTLARLARRHARSGAALTLVTADLPDPTGYGRIVRNADGRISRIVEDRDATAAERRVTEINCGIYCAVPGRLLAALGRVRPSNAQGEYYLTDAVRELLRAGAAVEALAHDGNPSDVLGVNTREDLARANASLYLRKARDLMDGGVTILDPARTWIDPRARVGRDTIVYPDVLIEGRSRIGQDCVIRSGTRLTDVRIGDRVEILEHCVARDARIDDGARLGPFAHLRPASVLEAGCHVGNFVELKKTRLGRGSKANHLTYLGDATIGPDCNVGAGTITCNYDGASKFPTRLGRGVFIGSDTQIVAPVRIGDGAYVAAGTTVVDDVPAGALAISRAKQANVAGWVARRKRAAASRPRRSRST
jgi:bifunctional UDP-N-acetylglucosamine pyrophosphorylase/glucosamine-1-phosphate N-acetyltransferase